MNHSPHAVRRASRSRGFARAAALATLTLAMVGLVPAVRFAWLRREAESAAERSNWREAHRLASAALAHRPRDPRSNRVIVRALTRLNRPVEAAPYLDRATGLDARELHLVAAGLLGAGKGDEAREVYRRIGDLQPNDALALKRLAALEMARSEWIRAEAIAKRLMTLHDGRVAGHTLAGSIYHHLGQRGIANMLGMSVREFEEVLALDPDLDAMPLPRRLFWSQFAEGLLREGRASEARRFLERAIAEENEDAGLLSLLGRTYLANGEIERAEVTWRRASRLDPRASEPWLHLGRLALKRSELVEAVHLLNRSSELAPESTEALYALVLAHRGLGDGASAEKVQRRLDQLRSPR